MRSRSFRIKPGQQCWAAIYEPLPVGLKPGHSLTVVAEQGWMVTARDAAGADWTLDRWQIERLEFEDKGGVWQDEGEPQVLDYLEKQYIESADEPWPPGSERGLNLAIIAAILQRHGREIPRSKMAAS